MTVYHSYRYCGFTLRSSLAFPELPRVCEDEPWDLELREGPVPRKLPGGRERCAVYELSDREAIWRLDGVARYHIGDAGRVVRVEPAPGAQTNAVRLFLLHPVFTLAALMRGEFMLNAAAVQTHRGAIAVTGMSSIGKSTAAAILVQQGHRLVSDGLLRIARGANGEVVAHPQSPWLLLWPDTLTNLGMGAPQEAVRDGIHLKRVRVPSAEAPMPLAKIAVLRAQRGDDLDLFENKDQKGRSCFAALTHNTAGNTWIESFPSIKRKYFSWVVSVVGRTPPEALMVPWGWMRKNRMISGLTEWSRSETTGGR